MQESDQISYGDRFVCVKHSNPVAVVTFEEGISIQNQLLCGQCLNEATRISPNQLPWNKVKAMISVQQKKRLSKQEQYLNTILGNIEDVETIVDQIRKKWISNIDLITSTTSNWKKQIALQKSASQFNTFQELEMLIHKEKLQKNNSIEEFKVERMKSSFHQLCNDIQTLLSFQELGRLQKMVEKIQVYLEKDQLLENSMKTSRKSDNSQTSRIKCLCTEHKTVITMINLEKNIDPKKRTLCCYCQLQNVIPTFIFEQRWRQYQDSLQKSQNEKLAKMQLDADQIKLQIASMKQEVMKDFYQITLLVDTSVKKCQFEIQKQEVQKNYEINLEQLQLIAQELSQNEIDQEYLQDKQFDSIQIELNSQLLIKYTQLSQSFNKGISDLKDFAQLQKTVYAKSMAQQPPQQKSQFKPITYKLVNEIINDQLCFAIAFNDNGTIMAAGCGNQINIWDLNKGNLSPTKHVLQGHAKNVNCLVFSKKANWFASGSYDMTIRCWKEMGQKNWISSQPGAQHKSVVNCLLLNNAEDQLLSCSDDNSIKVWKVDCMKNELIMEYSLEMHTSCVYCISLNESQTYLVSCSKDKQIIIWRKGQSCIWEFKYVIVKSVDDFGKRICFINNNIIAWQQNSQGITHIFELESGVFKEKPGLQVVLNQTSDDNYYFPSVYNKKRQVLIQKHNRYVYIIRQLQDKRFKIESQPIDCDHTCNYGGLTNDGSYLVIWNFETKQFRVYKINYE